MEDKHKDPLQILPIADTVSGSTARENPKHTLEHYERLANQFWLSSKVSDVADNVFLDVQRGSTTWGSLSGPYGFGKTASAIALWAHARDSEFLAIPPLSCTNFNELAAGIAALAGVQNPEIKRQVDKLFRDVFTEGLKPIVQADAKRYAVSPRTVRKIYNDKFSAGQFTVDSHPHRTVEFLSKLAELATKNSKGLVIILDELQQLLGPLDARAIVQFREFVWGLRTERSSCGIIVALDSLLEARLARWASDILHRIRESGPTLQLTNIYTREFPAWLWNKFSSNGKQPSHFPLTALSENVLTSLGQFVERPDLANGPRTVVDVFSRSAIHYQDTRSSYDIPDLVDDIRQGRFRYFGEGAAVQSILTQILSDEWILEDKGRKKLVTTLVAFPQGCPKKILHDQISDKMQIEKARSELFAPLLVELSEGLALEPLQQVRRVRTDWEQILSRCWETLPSLDALVGHASNMILRILAPKIFPKGTPIKPIWEWPSDESSAALTGWYILRGTFHDDYPQREIALYVADKEPESWIEDVDVSIALVCDPSTDPDADSKVELLDKNDGSCILIRLPILKPLSDRIPTDLQRYEKYVQPEPFRPVTILAALHDLEAFLGDLIDNPKDTDTSLSPEEQVEMEKGKVFAKIAGDFILRELLSGTVDIAEIGSSISSRGPELLRALFIQVCRRRFPDYQTLTTTIKWQDVLSDYREGLSSRSNSSERQGQEEIIMSKAKLYETLFGQMSTAAGDSFIKKLGPFVETQNNSESFSLRLTMHPAEKALIDYFKGLSNHQSIPFDAAVEFLSHQGYLETETEEIVKILVARECLSRDSNGNIRFILSPEIERKQLLDKITEMNDTLDQLEMPNDVSLINENTPLTDLQEHLNQQQVRLKAAIEMQITNLENGTHSLQNLIGTVNAASLPTEWLDSDLSTHLKGISSKLKDIQGTLLKALRKELERVKKELDLSAGTTDVEWAITQKDKRVSFCRTLQSLKDRVAEFEKREKALASWQVLNGQLRSTDALCAKVSETDSPLKQILSQLVSEFKEYFATGSWDPLLTSSDFSERLEDIQSKSQNLLYSHLQTFNTELSKIRHQFNSLLPSIPPPIFDVNDHDSMHESFQKLYQWVFEGFRTVLAECQEMAKNGELWRNIESKRRNLERVELGLQDSEGRLDFATVQRIGKTILLIQRDFTDGLFGIFDNPDEPPNFGELKRLFKEGKIQIQVTRKT